MPIKTGNFLRATALAAVLALSGPHWAAAAEATAIRMAYLRIKPERLEAFMALAREEMAASLRLEPGVTALYAVADKDDPARLTFFEMYADEQAYEAHRNTPHFQKYFHATKDMIEERILVQAVPAALYDKHTAPAESNTSPVVSGQD